MATYWTAIVLFLCLFVLRLPRLKQLKDSLKHFRIVTVVIQSKAARPAEVISSQAPQWYTAPGTRVVAAVANQDPTLCAQGDRVHAKNEIPHALPWDQPARPKRLGKICNFACAFWHLLNFSLFQEYSTAFSYLHLMIFHTSFVACIPHVIAYPCCNPQHITVSFNLLTCLKGTQRPCEIGPSPCKVVVSGWHFLLWS